MTQRLWQIWSKSSSVDFRNAFLLTIHCFSSPGAVLSEFLRQLIAPPVTCFRALVTQCLRAAIKQGQSSRLSGLASFKASHFQVISRSRFVLIPCAAFSSIGRRNFPRTLMTQWWVALLCTRHGLRSQEKRLKNCLTNFPPSSWSKVGLHKNMIDVCKPWCVLRFSILAQQT